MIKGIRLDQTSKDLFLLSDTFMDSLSDSCIREAPLKLEKQIVCKEVLREVHLFVVLVF